MTEISFMSTTPGSEISFVRLTDVSLDAITAHMGDTRLAEHMPLLKGEWTNDKSVEFIAHKESYWQRDGLGHWAILSDGAYVGWGGFQLEHGEWDYGLVLKPGLFGLGPRITRKAIDFAKADPHIDHVTFLLPPSRKHLSALDRLGAQFVGEISYDGEVFRKFSLETPTAYSAASWTVSSLP